MIVARQQVWHNGQAQWYNGCIMTLKWYEEHMQAVVRQNEQLKFKLRKLEQKTPLSRLVELFGQLFPDIPRLSEEVVQGRGVEAVLDYYHKVVHVWLQKEKAKLDFLMASSRRDHHLDSSLSNSKSTVNLNRTVIQRRYRRCDQDLPSKDLTGKISELQKKIKEMKGELQQFEINEHKYLGEIALLRSITKKLEYQLSEKVLAQERLQSLHLNKLRKANQELIQVRREVAMWKGQYERIWLQQQSGSGGGQRQCGGRECGGRECGGRECGGTGECSTTGSNIWTIRSTDFQRSYTIEK